jgi:hypothetical protein
MSLSAEPLAHAWYGGSRYPSFLAVPAHPRRGDAVLRHRMPYDYIKFLSHRVRLGPLRVNPAISDDGTEAQRVGVPVHEKFQVRREIVWQAGWPGVPAGLRAGQTRALSRILAAFPGTGTPRAERKMRRATSAGTGAASTNR